MFDKNDVKILAEAVIEEHRGSNRDWNSPLSEIAECNFCFAMAEQTRENWHNHETIKHESDCPVLVARDVLTRIDE